MVFFLSCPYTYCNMSHFLGGDKNEIKAACNDNKCRVTLQHKYCNWRIFTSCSSRRVDLDKVKSYRVGNICLPRDRNKGNKVICKTWDIKEEDLVCKCKDEKKRQVLKGKHMIFLKCCSFDWTTFGYLVFENCQPETTARSYVIYFDSMADQL